MARLGGGDGARYRPVCGVAVDGANEQVFRNFFDPCGNLTNHIDGAVKNTRRQFDVLNRCTNTVYADGSTEAFTFDAAGNLLTAKNAATTNAFGYDSMNRLAVSTSRVAGVAFATAYLRDLGGNTTNLTYPGGNAVRYLFDADGRVTNVTDWAGHSWRITRDAAGRMTGMTYPNGITGAWSYDARHAVSSWAYSGATNLPGRTITRDKMGLKTKEDVTGPMPQVFANRRAVNTFNNADRLTSAQVTLGTNVFAETYLYDGCGALTNLVHGNGTNDVLSYDLAWRMVSAMTTNSLQSTTGSLFTCAYDALGNRVRTSVKGTNRLWVVDHSDPLKRPLMETTTNGVPVRYYIWGAGRLLGVIESNGTLRCAHVDDMGSVVALTDAGGAVAFTASYGPYGEPWGTSGTNATPFGWMGGHGVFHVDGGSLYLTRYRAYDTTLKRFLSADLLGLGGGANLYMYALGNPLAYTDPLGLGPVGDYLEDMGQMYVGYGRAVGDTASGLYNVVAHPIDTAVGLYNVAAHPAQAYDAISTSVANTWNSGYAGQGEILGNILIAAGTIGSGAAAATTRVAEIASAEAELTKGMSTWKILSAYDKGSKALNDADYLALGGGDTTAMRKAAMMEQGVDAAGNAYTLTTTPWENFTKSLGLVDTGLTPKAALGAGLVGGGLETLGLLSNEPLPFPNNSK